MSNPSKYILELKTSLKSALKNGNYNPPFEAEQGLLKYLESVLVMARSPYIHDITFIISGYMAIADKFDIERGDKSCNFKSN